MSRRGILSYGVHLPYRRLDRSAIAAVAGKGGGSGARTVASYDEDTTTMAVEAARHALRPLPEDADRLTALWFSTSRPAYADKTNATAIHAALRLDPGVPAFDANGATRSAVGALHAARFGTGRTLIIGSDMVSGLPGSADEASGGDAAAALVLGDEGDGSLLAEIVGGASVTEEFLDRWRAPGASHAQLWEERFGEGRYVDAGVRAWDAALADAGLENDQIDLVVVAGAHARAGAAVVRKLGLAAQHAACPTAEALSGSVGFAGAAQPFLALAAALDDATPGQTVALLTLADGADVLVMTVTEALATARPAQGLQDQIAAGGSVPYGTYLAWRGHLTVDPPRRPAPARPSAAASGRSVDWKFGFVGSGGEDGTVHLPPEPGAATAVPMADVAGSIVTFTIDKLAYSPSPPVVFAVVDFDGGGRLPIELTDVDPASVGIGDRVEMTFRRLFTADGIHNYFWKARPSRVERPDGEAR